MSGLFRLYILDLRRTGPILAQNPHFRGHYFQASAPDMQIRAGVHVDDPKSGLGGNLRRPKVAKNSSLRPQLHEAAQKLLLEQYMT